MRTSRAVVSCVCLAAIALVVSCNSPKKDVLAITHVTVVDMSGAPPRADQTVIIEKQRIAALGPSTAVSVPRGAQLLDAKGKFLIPGLADMHIHLTAAGEPDGSRNFMLPLLIANGITTVRDMGGYVDSLVPLRKEIEEGKRIGPSIVYAGPYLDGDPPSFQPSLVIKSRADAERGVRQVVLQTADLVKVQSALSREAYFAIAEVAKQEHIPFVGHVPDRITAAEAADAGQRSIEHLTNVLRGCSHDERKLMQQQFDVSRNETALQAHARVVRWQKEILDSYSQEMAAALIGKFAQRDVWQVPTMVLLKHDAFHTLSLAAPAEERMQYVPLKVHGVWEKGHAAQMQFVTIAESELRGRLFAKSASTVAQMEKHGVKILAGTDSPAPYLVPGFSLHEELALLVEAGLTPMEALESATRRPAEFLDRTKDSGTIAAGKYADLVLLDADPLADIHNTEKIRAVILRGKLLDRRDLDVLLIEEQKFASVH